MASGVATVKEVISGDTLVLVGAPKGELLPAFPLQQQQRQQQQQLQQQRSSCCPAHPDYSPAGGNDPLEKVYAATVEEVLSGDSVILKLPSGTSRRVYFASIRCLRPAGLNKTQSREDEAIALEAKELVRKKTIGKMVKCPGAKRDAEGNLVPEPFAAEARFFVEIRLLNRDVTVRVEGSDDYGNLLGTVYHPNGLISLLLLSNGFARVNNATAQLTEEPQRLRQAMKEAQANRLRRWKDYSPAGGNDPLEKVYAATVEEVLSGDSVILKLPSGTSRRVYFASIRCLRPAGLNKTQSREDEAIALEAKELVRKKTIGKMVKVFLEYVRAPLPTATGGAAPPPSDSKGNMHFVSLYVGSLKLLSIPEDYDGSTKLNEERKGQNVSELLLQAGLARTVPHRAEDDQAERYDVYQQLEKEAQAAKRGQFAAAAAIKVVRLVDLMGPANAQRAVAHLQQLQRYPQIEAIVENVFNAARFRLRIPSQSLIISFALSGIRCPQTARGPLPGAPKERAAEPYGPEALQFSRSRVLQREVYIQVEQCDRGGNFIGTLLYNSSQQQQQQQQQQHRVNLAVELLAAGLAQTVPFSLARSACREALAAAEAAAKANRINLWGLPGALEEDNEPPETFLEKNISGVVVSHIDKFDSFYIQEERSDKLDSITAEIREATAAAATADSTYTLAGMPRKGEVILGLHVADGQWYRARVEGREGQQLSVCYIDFGLKEKLGLSQIRRCPPSLTAAAVPPQATHCMLSGAAAAAAAAVGDDAAAAVGDDAAAAVGDAAAAVGDEAAAVGDDIAAAVGNGAAAAVGDGDAAVGDAAAAVRDDAVAAVGDAVAVRDATAVGDVAVDGAGAAAAAAVAGVGDEKERKSLLRLLLMLLLLLLPIESLPAATAAAASMPSSCSNSLCPSLPLPQLLLPLLLLVQGCCRRQTWKKTQQTRCMR
ncbi:tudor / staphylococcal nuclease domain-containing protein, putative [Eimeria tenella]|uniref:Tudor / staphylococcal nuclease domain-containing protein, putative n=1 Tax=Eimeria tenella TaxID=5802 RepID=U6L6D1_EIMTE|nr:tudor / staphylococcal nuclease domain-containing protein, putative [Eimeria tenella]CDJ43360.1 tudor / staphylococcal nuclease domain-containing protein, putative [Eimeria tenella]|eukprot:XP_013234110.1 tudor / staphylococcal nuclease domain-containing protein, putative [Eimeria tenella]